MTSEKEIDKLGTTDTDKGSRSSLGTKGTDGKAAPEKRASSSAFALKGSVSTAAAERSSSRPSSFTIDKPGKSADDDHDADRGAFGGEGMRLVPLMRNSANSAASTSRTPPLNLGGLRVPGHPAGLPGGLRLPGGVPTLVPNPRSSFVRPVSHPLLRGLAKPRTPLSPTLTTLIPKAPMLRNPSAAGRPPLVAPLAFAAPAGGAVPGKPDVANSLALLARVGGVEGGAAAAELDGIKEALLQAEATEAYLAAKQDEIANALLAAAASSASASDAMTKALLAAAVTNPLSASDIETLLTAVAASTPAQDLNAPASGAGGEDALTRALLAAAADTPGVDIDALMAATGRQAQAQADGASLGQSTQAEASASGAEQDALTKALMDVTGSNKESPADNDSLLQALATNTTTPDLDAASSASVPDEMTKALLAAVATNTPSAAGDADKIIKAVLRAATASQSEAEAFGEKDAIEPERPEKRPIQEPPLPDAPPLPAAPDEKKKEPIKMTIEKPRPREGMVNPEVLKTLSDNAKATARSMAARAAFGLGIANKDKGKDKPGDVADAEAEKTADSGTKAWIFLGKISKGTSGGLIRAECAKYGQVTSILYNAEPDSLFEEPWALVSMTSLDAAATAVQKLESRRGLFGGSQPVEVRMGTPEDLERWEELVKAGEQVKPAAPPVTGIPTPGGAPLELAVAEAYRGAGATGEFEDPYAQRRRSRSRRADERGDRPPRGDSRDSMGARGRREARGDGGDYSRRDRRRSMSDSRSASREPLPKPSTGKKRVYGLGGFDNSLALENIKMPKVSPADMVPSSDRRIGTRGSWAEFVTREWEYYYVNIHTGEKRWMLPVAEMRGVAPRRS